MTTTTIVASSLSSLWFFRFWASGLGDLFLSQHLSSLMILANSLRDLVMDFCDWGHQGSVAFELLFQNPWLALGSGIPLVIPGVMRLSINSGSRIDLGIFGDGYYSVDFFIVNEFFSDDLHLLSSPLTRPLVRHRLTVESLKSSMVLYSSLNCSTNILVDSLGL
ncbi:hypothetical protein PIB30_079046 [Stylosanthes scabra]|uniref:Uncharacterized protein n=1 Tax=Stylosanthes scabra TaxID=79078 RepID=A0ABU6SSY4_9FABA|nr:hypothetical protein [Stylosanthes scabra]